MDLAAAARKHRCVGQREKPACRGHQTGWEGSCGGGGGGGRGEGKGGRPGTISDLRTLCAAIRPFCLGGPKIGVQYTEAPLIRAMQA